MTNANPLNTFVDKRPLQQYRGRFAPSPSGPLHFGSLIAALASFCQAKEAGGKWLVRIEDIDPPREQPGADKAILKTLEAFGLHWDEEVLYQSQQHQLYLETLDFLSAENLSYGCDCSRAKIKKIGGIYQRHCRDLNLSGENLATRLVNHHPFDCFEDKIQGLVKQPEDLAREDFIIFRRDGLFAYQLAVVVDDIYQGITEIVRGCDLLQPTCRQLTLFKTLGIASPDYAHVPLAITDEGYKLSKQNGAPAIDEHRPQELLYKALKFLGQPVTKDIIDCSVDEVIQSAIANWQLFSVPKDREIVYR
ncbi:tRNA glutamyl-Q(34) synthetase GluQRS [Thalassotalea sp. PS06]|uniref:tRNA glutamyl-Q(34) synthetase GluQRS n=1 Tax=Thalassotalea sp. PS06 TaxID=2594005 RepID=UPI0011641AC3|nr:tRNA glutamyl-Q(34) synthetase GluQRS [Thalassotalea sp. PS06]QDP00128.1 tRNA glutamyl-Q(34) synthetase GluQRS [Thalassotalea sp. PS06]